MPHINPQYKDRLFIFIFGREENKHYTLNLYNAINHSNYTDPSQLQITTIENILYLGMHNDVSFMIADQLNLYEQQSSLNPNMPIRCFLYMAKLFEKLLSPIKHKLYWKTLIKLPAPKIIIFYNGKDKVEDESILKLSDAYPENTEGDIEVKVRMININFNHNKRLLDACRPLWEYSWIIDQIRNRPDNMSIEDTVDKIIAEMADNYILKPFMEQHKAEVKGMILTEYNEEEVMNGFKEEGRNEGINEGKLMTLKTLVTDKILSIADAARRANLSEKDFIKYMEQNPTT